MWWSDRIRPIVVASAIMAVAACGFEPLHKQGTASGAAQLSGIEVAPIEDRIGQLLRNELRGYLTPRGTSGLPQWELQVSLEESIAEVLLEETSFATRADLRVTATFRLISLVDEEISSPSASASETGSYNILQASSEYANLVSERDTREKAVRLVARDIVRQVSVWLRDEPWKETDAGS